MATIDDLKKNVERLESQLDDARAKYHAALKDAHPVKVGDFMVSESKGRAQVTALKVTYGEVREFGRLVLKSGALAARERELYDFYGWRKTPPEKG